VGERAEAASAGGGDVVGLRRQGAPALGARGELPDVLPPADIAAAIRAYDWDYDEALRVAWCESRWRARTISPTGDYGVFQVNFRYHGWRVGGVAERLLDVETNVRVAHDIWAEQGWVPWRWSRECHGLS